MAPPKPFLTETGQRLLALALLAVPLLLGYAVLIAPYRQLLAENRERIADLQFQLERLQKVVSRIPLWQQQLKELEAFQADNRYYLTGTTPALASAALQNLLGEVVREADGEMASTQTLPAKSEDGFTRIAVRIRFSASTTALRQILHTIESGRPLLIVENLTVRPMRGRRDPRTRQIVPVDKLNVDMRVAGYMMPQP